MLRVGLPTDWPWFCSPGLRSAAGVMRGPAGLRRCPVSLYVIRGLMSVHLECLVTADRRCRHLAGEGMSSAPVPRPSRRPATSHPGSYPIRLPPEGTDELTKTKKHNALHHCVTSFCWEHERSGLDAADANGLRRVRRRDKILGRRSKRPSRWPVP